MNISENCVVLLDYKLKDDSGNIIDSSDGEPMSYIHGTNSLIPGLEKKLQGKKKGDSFSCKILPEEAYGSYDDELVTYISKDNFEDPSKVKVGMQFQSQDAGGWRIVTVLAVEGDKIKIDANHPMAGKTLNFDINVVDVHAATEEELAALYDSCSCDDGCGCGNGCSCGDDCECGCDDDDGSCGCGSCH